MSIKIELNNDTTISIYNSEDVTNNLLVELTDDSDSSVIKSVYIDEQEMFDFVSGKLFDEKVKYTTYHLDIDIPYRVSNDFIPLFKDFLPNVHADILGVNASEFFIKKQLTEIPVIENLCIEPIGCYNNGLGWSVIFDVPIETVNVVNHALCRVFDGFSYELVLDNKNETLQNVINNATQKAEINNDNVPKNDYAVEIIKE